MRKTAEESAKSHRNSIVDFFNTSYGWWDDVYDTTLPKRFFSYEMLKRRRLVVQLLEKHATDRDRMQILECGCGPGGILRKIDCNRHRVTGVDINPRCLTKARKMIGGQVNWIQADIENLPFPEQTFDMIYCVGVLSYLKNDDLAIAEMARIVKPGGIIIISLPNFIMLDKIFDPYYYIVWIWITVFQKIKSSFSISKTCEQEFNAFMIRRCRQSKIVNKFADYDFSMTEYRNVSFGPLTLWRHEFLPLRWSKHLSEWLLMLSHRKQFAFLHHLTNHWIACLRKAES